MDEELAHPVGDGPRTRPRVSILGLAGELLLTIGVIVCLFLGWQLWFNDLVVGGEQNSAGLALAQTWAKSAAPDGVSSPSPSAAPSDPVKAEGTPGKTPQYGTPVVSVAPQNTRKFAVMYVPRFGADYVRSVSEGVGTVSVLDKDGIGHYPDTQMPGQVGNFAVAAHRTTHGAPFSLIGTLRVGDRIYIQTEQGYYTYIFRNLEYVLPTGIGVKDPVPQEPGASATDRVMTMTSCNPKFSAAERIIAYSVFESWQPTSAGPPAAISALVTKGS